MKKFTMLSAHAQALFAVLIVIGLACPSNAQDNTGPNATVPVIQMTDVPLSMAVDLLARQSELNYTVDCRVPFDRALVNIRWTNITARAALDKVLKEHDLELIDNSATTVVRIAPRNLHIKPIDPALVSNDTNAAVAVIQLTDAPLDQAITLLANQAHLKFESIESLINSRDGHVVPVVSFRWKNLTPRQALVALLDSYDLTFVEDPSTHELRIKVKPQTPATSSEPI